MINLIPYESINEAAKPLPDMPAFLKTAGAKPQHVQYGGPPPKDQTPNAWVIDDISNPQNPKDTWRIDFSPKGTFHTSANGGKGLTFLTSGGKWKANSTGTFTIGRKTIEGVDITFTTFLVFSPPT